LPKPDTAIIEISDLHMSYGQLKVLKGIDITLKQSELVFILGPSGSGKSTLLRCCNRLEKAQQGTIFFNGTDIQAPGVKINEIRRQIGMVFQ